MLLSRFALVLLALSLTSVAAEARQAEPAADSDGAEPSVAGRVAEAFRRLFGQAKPSPDDGTEANASSAGHGDVIRFADIVGVEQAKHALKQLVADLQGKRLQTSLPARPARGILLVGPPGVGKTLLARATFESAKGYASLHVSSGPALVADGEGLSSIRSLFATAALKTPALIFIDEIDVLALHPAHSKALGTAIDGYASHHNVHVIAAANSLDSLDPSLLRAGRFDQVVHLPLPNQAARHTLLTLRTQAIPQGDDVDLMNIAEFTAGLSGADVVNLVNLATAHAARAQRQTVAFADWDEAFDDIKYGPADLSRHFSDAERYRTAVHEAGHAAIAILTGPPRVLRKVSLISRHYADGYTDLLTTDDPPTLDAPFWNGRLATALGGHAAETHLLGHTTPGTSDDLHLAHAVARAMVAQWGMHKSVGPLGLGWANVPDTVHLLSETTKSQIDSACRDLVSAEYARAFDLIVTHSGAVTSLAKALLACGWLNGDEATDAFAGRPPARCNQGARF